MFCNLLTAAFTAVAVAMLYLQTPQETRCLAAAFSAEYLACRCRVFLYLGRAKEKHKKFLLLYAA